MPADNKDKTANPDGGDAIRTQTDLEDGSIEKLKHGEVDPALAFVSGERIEFTPEEERSVLRKIDWALMPLLCWVSFFPHCRLGC